MRQNELIVAETFYSIQGEGPYMGYPAVFLRLAGCNLLCEGAGWRCDTIEVWQKGKSIDFFHILTPEQITHLKDGAHLVITGGEPMLQQDAILDYLKWIYREFDFDPIVEIETNGTIMPISLFIQWVKSWNISFKLSNSGEPWEKRIDEDVLRFYNRFNSATFKIVIAQESDFIELINDFPYIDMKKVMLMPAGENQEQLAITRPIVIDICMKTNLRFSDRLHIVNWNKKTGV